METNQIALVNKDLNATIEAFNKIKEVAIYLANSDAFTKGFEILDKSGNPVLDETTGRPKINVADIAVCLMAGHEVGLDLTGSLLYGKKLNQATYISIMKGKSLGVDVATSIEKIVSIPTKNGYVSYTMVDIISAKLLQNNVSFLPFIKNYAPFYLYFNAKTNEEMELDKVLDEQDDIRPEYYIVDANSTPELVTKAKDEGKILITKKRSGYYSKAKFVRSYLDGRTVTLYQRFSTVDAERAGFLPVPITDATGKIIDYTKGKDNWNSNTPQMMNNRVISIGGRIIGADLINGVYTREEVIDAGLVKEENAPIVDAVVVN